MSQVWTYPQFRLAGSGSPFAMVAPRRSSFIVRYCLMHAPKAEPFFLFLAACAAAFLFTGMVFVAAKPVSSLVELIAPDMGTGFSGSISKERFLARLSAAQKSAVVNHAHYITQLIAAKGITDDAERKIALAIVVESFKANYDPLFVAAIIRSESSFNAMAVSHQGARGLMQLLPSTAKYISERHDLDWEGVHSLRDVESNIRLGIAYLQYLEKKFKGNREHALIAYNWGPANLANALKKGAKIPTPPVQYARKILNSSQVWRKELDSRLASDTHRPADSMFS